MVSIDTITATVKEFMIEEPRIIAVYLLGSAGRESMRANSDIDLAIMIDPKTKIPPLERMKLANNLSYALARTVDLGEISSKNLIYTAEAFFTGRCIYTKNKDVADLYRASLLGMYVQFNYDRREIMNAYQY